MSMTNEGGPAFPRAAFAPHDVGYQDVGIHDSQEGMSFRDYFAGKAIAGLMAKSDLVDLFAKGFAPSKGAEIAYMIADAMVAERTKDRTKKGGAV